MKRSTINFYDIAGANAASPELVSTFSRPQPPQVPHEFFLWADPRRPAARPLLDEPGHDDKDR